MCDRDETTTPTNLARVGLEMRKSFRIHKKAHLTTRGALASCSTETRR